MSQVASEASEQSASRWQPVSPHDGELARWECENGRHIAVAVTGGALAVIVSWSDVLVRFGSLHEAMLTARSFQDR